MPTIQSSSRSEQHKQGGTAVGSATLFVSLPDETGNLKNSA